MSIFFKNIKIKIFVFFFLYVLFFGLILQKVIIPVTPWHAGNGLLSSGDWILFQELAVEHVDKINLNGWTVFDWRPGGQGPAAYAAAIYVLTGIAEPWILLPLHGVVYAVAALGFFGIIRALSNNERIALWSLVPLVFMPSLAMVWGQIHKDLWVISALFLLLNYWVWLFLNKPCRWWLALILLFYVNASMVWMRPYVLQIILMGQFFLLLLLCATGLGWKNNRILLWGVFSILITIFSWNFTKSAAQENMSGTSIAASTGIVVGSENAVGPCKDWSYLLPNRRLDNTLMALACTRDRFSIYLPDARSNLDVNIKYSSAKDILYYIPRALQIGIFSPFPDMWFANGSTDASRLFRLIAAVETLVMYLGLSGIFVLLTMAIFGKGVIGFERNIAIFGIVIFTFLWVGVYALITGNVGSIYRVRFPVMMLWMGLGLLSWWRIIGWRRSRSLNVQF